MELYPIHVLIFGAIIALIFGGKHLPNIGGGGSGPDDGNTGGPQHPVPVTGQVETRAASPRKLP